MSPSPANSTIWYVFLLLYSAGLFSVGALDVFASIEDSDQPAHPRSLIRIFNRRSLCCQGSNVSSDGNLSHLCGCTD